MFPSQEFCFIPAVVCVLKRHGAFVEVREKIVGADTLLLPWKRGSQLVVIRLEMQTLSPTEPSHSPWVLYDRSTCPWIPLVVCHCSYPGQSGSGPGLHRLRALNGLTLLLGFPQQAPSRCHSSVVLRLGMLCISTFELPSRVPSPSRPQSNPPSPDISLTFQYSLQNDFSVPPVSLS